MKEKRNTATAPVVRTGTPSHQTEGKKARYLSHYCKGCRGKLESLGYIFTESGRASVWRLCELCGRFELTEPVEMSRPAPRYRKRTGAGERARAGRYAK